MSRKKRYIELSPESRASLEEGRKQGKTNTFRERCHYLLLSDQGKSIDEIADFYQVNRHTVSKWFTRYEELGIEGLLTQKGQGRKAIIRSENEILQIEKWVEEHPQNLKPVIEKVQQEFGKTMCKKTLQRLLKKGLEVETVS